jgi:hypothetical protein
MLALHSGFAYINSNVIQPFLNPSDGAATASRG